MGLSDWDYDSFAAETYDLWFGDEPYWDQRLYHERIAQNGGRALELGCGTGRLLVPYVRDGLTVEGLDASEEMLAICRRKLDAQGLDAPLHHQHMQRLDLPHRYRTIYIPAGSFQILAGRDEAMQTLRRCHEHLEPAGELIVSLSVPWRDFELDGQWRLRRSGLRADGSHVLIHECTRSDRIDQLQQIWNRYEAWRGGELMDTQLRTHQLRWYHRHEFTLMLEAVGFRDVSMRCGYGVTWTSDPEDDMVFIGRR